jgi:hypothetical protein
MDFNSEKRAFYFEVEEEAANLIKNGIATPYEAILIAKKTILLKRRNKYNKPLHQTSEEEPKCMCSPHNFVYYGCQCRCTKTL